MIVKHFKLSQPEKDKSAITVNPSENSTFFNLMQSLKAAQPILVTLLGMISSLIPLHPENAKSSILATLSGIIISVSPVQPSKAPVPILTVLFGKCG